MVLRTFLANIMADLQLAQLADQPGPEHQREEHSGKARVNRAKGDVAKYVERAEIFLQDVIEKVVEHLVAHLLCTGKFRRVNGEQAFYNAFHLHAARSLHQQQISWRDKISQELGGLFGRRKNSGLRAGQTR